jgi:hypothetical protein
MDFLNFLTNFGKFFLDFPLMDHGVCHVLEIEREIYSLCPKKNVILGILGQIIKEVK